MTLHKAVHFHMAASGFISRMMKGSYDWPSFPFARELQSHGSVHRFSRFVLYTILLSTFFSLFYDILLFRKFL